MRGTLLRVQFYCFVERLSRDHRSENERSSGHGESLALRVLLDVGKKSTIRCWPPRCSEFYDRF